MPFDQNSLFEMSFDDLAANRKNTICMKKNFYIRDENCWKTLVDLKKRSRSKEPRPENPEHYNAATEPEIATEPKSVENTKSVERPKSIGITNSEEEKAEKLEISAVGHEEDRARGHGGRNGDRSGAHRGQNGGHESQDGGQRGPNDGINRSQSNSRENGGKSGNTFVLVDALITPNMENGGRGDHEGQDRGRGDHKSHLQGQAGHEETSRNVQTGQEDSRQRENAAEVPVPAKISNFRNAFYRKMLNFFDYGGPIAEDKKFLGGSLRTESSYETAGPELCQIYRWSRWTASERVTYLVFDPGGEREPDEPVGPNAPDDTDSRRHTMEERLYSEEECGESRFTHEEITEFPAEIRIRRDPDKIRIQDGDVHRDADRQSGWGWIMVYKSEESSTADPHSIRLSIRDALMLGGLLGWSSAHSVSHRCHLSFTSTPTYFYYLLLSLPLSLLREAC